MADLTKKVRMVQRVDLTGTLNAMEIGENLKIKNNQAKVNTIRVTVTRLKSTKKEFVVSEKGLVGETLVIRTK